MSSLISRLLVSLIAIALISCDSTDAFDVNAGTDQTVQAGDTVTLVGNASSPDGTITSYEWMQTSGEAVELTGGNTSSVSFTAPTVTTDTTLTFQLIVNDSRGGRATDDVNVFVTVLLPPPDQTTNLELEPNNELAQADVLTLGDIVSGQVANDEDRDWFEVTLVAGTNYRIQFSGSEGLESVWGVNIYDSSNNLLALMAVAANGSATSNANLDIGIGVTGKYYVVLDSYLSNQVPTQPYAITATSSPISNIEIENNDSLSTADALTTGEPITGQVADETDQDWLGFSATAGTNYQVLFEGSEDIADATAAFWNVNVYDSSNNLLASTPVDGSDAVNSASLNIGIGVTGTYYVVIEHRHVIVDDAPSDVPTQSYTVTVNTL